MIYLYLSTYPHSLKLIPRIHHPQGHAVAVDVSEVVGLYSLEAELILISSRNSLFRGVFSEHEHWCQQTSERAESLAVAVTVGKQAVTFNINNRLVKLTTTLAKPWSRF
jgi:hypothetical protein